MELPSLAENIVPGLRFFFAYSSERRQPPHWLYVAAEYPQKKPISIIAIRRALKTFQQWLDEHMPAYLENFLCLYIGALGRTLYF